MIARPCVVLDTNVLLDLWVFDDSRTRPLRDALDAGQIDAVRSGESVDEFTDVIMREEFKLTTERRFDILRHWDRIAREVHPVFAAPLAPSDPSDRKFVDLAYSARAVGLFTRDKALLKLARRAQRDGLLIALPERACRVLGVQ